MKYNILPLELWRHLSRFWATWRGALEYYSMINTIQYKRNTASKNSNIQALQFTPFDTPPPPERVQQDKIITAQCPHLHCSLGFQGDYASSFGPALGEAYNRITDSSCGYWVSPSCSKDKNQLLLNIISFELSWSFCDHHPMIWNMLLKFLTQDF